MVENALQQASQPEVSKKIEPQKRATVGSTVPNVAQRHRMLRAMIGRVNKAIPPKDAEPTLEMCSQLLDLVEDALTDTTKKKWKGFEYDAAWSHLHEVRHQLCLLAPWDDLLEIAADTRGDAAYVPAQTERGPFLDELARVEQSLVSGAGRTEGETDLRRKLRRISIHAARNREKMWRRVHRIRPHLTHLSWALLGALVVAVVVVPLFLERTFVWHSHLDLLVLLFMGAFGSLVNSVRERDPTDASPIDFELLGVRRLVRPLLGASIVLVLWLASTAGFLKIPGLAVSGEEGDKVRGAVALLLAFFAGFLDVLVLGQVDRIGKRVIGGFSDSAPDDKDRRGDSGEGKKSPPIESKGDTERSDALRPDAAEIHKTQS